MAQYVRITGFPETPEDVFGMTIRGLLAQGVPSITEKAFPIMPIPRCMYRTMRDGVQVACGAGLWIPDKTYHRGMEGLPFSSIANQLGEKWTRPFLSSAITFMQKIHDEGAKVWIRHSNGDWPVVLKQAAIDVMARAHDHKLDVLVPTHWEEFFVPE